MPTGYTADIEKEDYTFKDFALTCSKAFSTFIHMRDEPLSSKISKYEKTDYYSKGLIEAEKNLDDFRNKSLNEKHSKFLTYIKTEVEYNRSIIKKKTKLKEKYEDFLKKASEYIPPTPDHLNYKNFMIERLESSIFHDCDVSYNEETLKKLNDMTFDEWHTKQVESLKRSINYYNKESEREDSKVDKNNKWIEQLEKSLEGYN